VTFGIAIFPYLKTSKQIYLGGLRFRSTLDVDDLAENQRKAVAEVAEMLFLKDDLKIQTASFAIVDRVDIDQPNAQFELLADIRSVVAYAYSSPHAVFDNILLTPEEASLVILTPNEVSKFLVYPEHHVTPTEGSLSNRVSADSRGMVEGYAGLFNFVEPLWVVPGSRLYPPRPQATLNIQQDLAADFSGPFHGSSGVGELLQLLGQPKHSSRTRVFKALKWYNHANEAMAGKDRALLNLAVAFEALFDLPENAKSDRLADSISLILGRTERIQEWAVQFYAARSRVAHEGAAQEYYYRPTPKQKSDSDERFGSLMSLGRTIFRLCLATLLVGIAMSDKAGLAAKLVSNTERYKKICTILNDHIDEPSAALGLILPICKQIKEQRYVQSTPVNFDLMLGALRLSASTLIKCAVQPNPAIIMPLGVCAKSATDQDLFAQLDGLRQLQEAFKNLELSALSECEQVLQILADEIWHHTFTTYFALKRERQTCE
jgi:Apea-like HEPN